MEELCPRMLYLEARRLIMRSRWRLASTLRTIGYSQILTFTIGAATIGVLTEQLGSRGMHLILEVFAANPTYHSDPAWSPSRNVSSFIDVSALPLRTSGRSIIDRNGQRVRLRCVNWYGAHLSTYVVGGLHERPLPKLAMLIRALGFNCVRLPYSLEMQLTTVWPSSQKLRSNPTLVNKTGIEVLDATVDALTAAGLLVVLNNHQGPAMWCCSEYDGEGLWYTALYPEQVWLDSLGAIAKRYKSTPLVIGYDLRNEPRGAYVKQSVGSLRGRYTRPTWGTGEADTDWAAAAIRGALVVTESDPNALLIVEGLDFATDLRGTRSGRALHQHEELVGRVIYEAHDYCWYHVDFKIAWGVHCICIGWALCLAWQTCRIRDKKSLLLRLRFVPVILAASSWSAWLASYAHFEASISERWGFLVDNNVAPVWLGEFGTNGIWVTADWLNEVGEVTWWSHIVRYIRERDLDFAYWALNGDNEGKDETFGLLERDYASLRHAWILESLSFE